MISASAVAYAGRQHLPCRSGYSLNDNMKDQDWSNVHCTVEDRHQQERDGVKSQADDQDALGAIARDKRTGKGVNSMAAMAAVESINATAAISMCLNLARKSTSKGAMIPDPIASTRTTQEYRRAFLSTGIPTSARNFSETARTFFSNAQAETRNLQATISGIRLGQLSH
jgi:hypothetical protein